MKILISDSFLNIIVMFKIILFLIQFETNLLIIVKQVRHILESV